MKEVELPVVWANHWGNTALQNGLEEAAQSGMNLEVVRDPRQLSS